MTALDVVGVDLQAGLAGHLSLLREEKVLVFLVSVGLVGSGPNQHSAAKNGFGLPIQDALVEEAARPVGLRMLDVDVVVDMLAARCHVEAVQGAGAAGRVQQHLDVVPGDGCAPGVERGGENAVLTLVNAADRHVKRPLALQEKLVVLDLGPVTDDDLRHGVGEVA